tara:strand:- start:23 stop:565 length:543 start_codon:yes stop_codon:yes gene_type:complete
MDEIDPEVCFFRTYYPSFMIQPQKQPASATTSCPCSSGKLLSACCSPILADHALARTPEQLMRSRYTAFVYQDSIHLLRSWDIPSRPQSLNFDDTIVWLELDIEEAPLPSPSDDFGYVRFKATFIQNDCYVKMKEKSVFVRKNNLWFYLRGELQKEETPISLKSQCPCGSGKKYKRCCRH